MSMGHDDKIYNAASSFKKGSMELSEIGSLFYRWETLNVNTLHIS